MDTSNRKGGTARRGARVIPSPSPVEWLCLAGGLFLALRYFWFFDDAFVYFRYIDNWLFLKVGLVYNQGEYVEGFTSPLWLLLLSFLRAPGLSYLVIVRALTVVSFVVFWGLLVRLNREFSPHGAPVVNFPLAYLAFNYAVLSYFSSGMETPLVQVMAVVCALYIMKPASRGLGALFALSPLIRPELALPLAICIAWSWLSTRKFPLSTVAAALLLNGSWLLFRVYYYADLLPNTFYLKDTVNIAQGISYLLDTVRPYHLGIVVVAFAAAAVVLKAVRRRRVDLESGRRLVMLLAAASVALYAVKVGGAAIHYLYLAFPFCLAVCACAGIPEQLIRALGGERFSFLGPLIGLSIAAAAFSSYPAQLEFHPCLLRGETRKEDRILDAQWHRMRPGLQYESWGERVTPERLRAHREKSPGMVYDGTIVKGWCRGNYVRYDKRVIHRFGLTDAILARVDITGRRPGHKYMLRKLAEDILAVHESSPGEGPGMYRRAVEEGRAPDWMRTNLESIDIIEGKVYNDHDFRENLGLAFTFPRRIEP